MFLCLTCPTYVRFSDKSSSQMVRGSENDGLAHSGQTLTKLSKVPEEYNLTVLREERASEVLDEFRKDALAGLAKQPKSISSKYFYDANGSELFAEISELDEYYPTRTEYSILQRYGKQIASDTCCRGADGSSETVNIVELGAGDGRKTKVLLHSFVEAGITFEYMPIDISRRAMDLLFSSMHGEFGTDVKVHGFIGDSADSLDYIASNWPDRRIVVIFLGSSIGNYSKEDGIDFLSNLRSSLKQRDMLLAGFDLKKDAEILRLAYSDAKGVTRDFNLNLLSRLNRELGANLDESSFEHIAMYNPVQGAMESYLISKKDQTVRVAGQDFHFEEREPLHTEVSHKYILKEVEFMLRKAGFSTVSNFMDENRWFVDVLAEIRR